MMSVGIIENIPLRQGGTRLDGHQNHSNKAYRVRGIDVKGINMGCIIFKIREENLC